MILGDGTASTDWNDVGPCLPYCTHQRGWGDVESLPAA